MNPWSLCFCFQRAGMGMCLHANLTAHRGIINFIGKLTACYLLLPLWWVCANVYMCVWRLKVNEPSILFFEAGTLTRPGTLWLSLASQCICNPPVSDLLVLGLLPCLALFLTWPLGFYLGFQATGANASAAELSPQLSCLLTLFPYFCHELPPVLACSRKYIVLFRDALGLLFFFLF